MLLRNIYLCGLHCRSLPNACVSGTYGGYTHTHVASESVCLAIVCHQASRSVAGRSPHRHKKWINDATHQQSGKLQRCSDNMTPSDVRQIVWGIEGIHCTNGEPVNSETVSQVFHRWFTVFSPILSVNLSRSFTGEMGKSFHRFTGDEFPTLVPKYQLMVTLRNT